jgi:hypothetical protein
MNLTYLEARRAATLPLLTLAIVLFANITNRCADGFCYTYGWPWVAYYGWSDAGIIVNGRYESGGRQGLVLAPFAGDLAVASVLLLGAFLLQAWWWSRRAAN